MDITLTLTTTDGDMLTSTSFDTDDIDGTASAFVDALFVASDSKTYPALFEAIRSRLNALQGI